MCKLTKRIHALEEKLLHSDMQESPFLLDELLAQSFEEIGSMGNITSRQAVVEWLMNKNKNDRWILTNFRISELSTDIVLAIYQAQKVGDSNITAAASIRSSIWKRHGSHWKMVFKKIFLSTKSDVDKVSKIVLITNFRRNGRHHAAGSWLTHKSRHTFERGSRKAL